MRREPQTPPAAIGRRRRTDDTRTYRFLTYVMGGGVQVKDHVKLRDEVTPIRAASIRGQLRFWWRACNPSGCTTVEQLRQREGEIWGTTSQPSQVVVEVLEQPGTPASVDVYEYKANDRLGSVSGMEKIAYGAFPLQPSREAQRERWGRGKPGTLSDYGTKTFKVRFSYPAKIEADVTTALWAWETFGGLGARTRRGFGAITRVDASRSLAQIERELQAVRSSVRISGVPSLSGSRLATARTSATSSLGAWKNTLEVLQALRQGVNLGRNRSLNGKPAGRSRWPEPDEIRRLTGKAALRHSKPTVTVERFPRASFGLPIVFHFEAHREGDPNFNPLQIHPVGSDRFPSSLILRPLPDGSRFWPAALALSIETPEIVLTYGEENKTPVNVPVQWQLDPTLAAPIPVMNDRTARPSVFIDPIDRFLWELKK